MGVVLVMVMVVVVVVVLSFIFPHHTWHSTPPITTQPSISYPLLTTSPSHTITTSAIRLSNSFSLSACPQFLAFRRDASSFLVFCSSCHGSSSPKRPNSVSLCGIILMHNLILVLTVNLLN
ncbi:hypothetical protein E2C01_057974 [Portunus trituberculatus]|uniref:Uncharacterized protein n=1 Tax=Portunus trituberculatus TaxID=210409 RepID=A0A5B7H3F1_PORTR|nr:hypothetical protein [Portunus trituberculatus]